MRKGDPINDTQTTKHGEIDILSLTPRESKENIDQIQLIRNENTQLRKPRVRNERKTIAKVTQTRRSDKKNFKLGKKRFVLHWPMKTMSWRVERRIQKDERPLSWIRESAGMARHSNLYYGRKLGSRWIHIGIL